MVMDWRHRLARRVWAAEASGPAGWLSAAASPAGWVYAQLARLNTWAYAHNIKKSSLAGRPVISVGNLAVGGTGKTPVVAFLAEGLIARGFKVAVLTRGYGGRVGPGPLVVTPELDPDLAGDEPLVLAGIDGLTVIAGSDRSAGARLAEEMGAEVFLLDDGFQHLALVRSLDLVLLDAAAPLANGRCHPAGPLREPPSALARADAFILTRARDREAVQRAEALVADLAPGRPVWTARHLVDGAYDPLDGREVDLSGLNVTVAAGVARPEDVADSVARLGPAKVELIGLADHQRYGAAEVERLNRRLSETKAEALVTTAKDWVKLAPAAEKIETPIRVARLRLVLDDAEGLWKLVEEAVEGLGRVPGVLARSKRRLPETGRILVRLPNWIGDAVMAAPVLANLRRGLPGWRVAALATPWTAPLFSADPNLDEMLVYHPHAAHKGLGGRRRLGRELAGRFDVGLLLPNSFDSALIFFLAGLKRRIGYARDGRSALLTDAVPVTRPLLEAHHIEYYLGLLSHLGLPVAERVPSLSLSPELERWADRFLAELGVSTGETLIGLAPGAAFGPAKRWPAERFAEAAKALIQARGGRALIFGSAGEADSGRKIARSIGPAAVNLAGQTSLEQAAALVARLEVMLTNDSGLMHLAAALDRPLVAVFGPTDPARTGPRGRRQAIITAGADCAPCLAAECELGSTCLNRISVDEVVAAAEALLREASRPPAR